MKKLTINEQIFLAAILKVGEDAYGVNIRKKIIEMTGGRMLFGTLYNTLDYLLKKGYVLTRKGESTPQRGGHNKVYYTVTSEGIAALKKAKELQEKLWDGLHNVMIEK